MRRSGKVQSNFPHFKDEFQSFSSRRRPQKFSQLERRLLTILFICINLFLFVSKSSNVSVDVGHLCPNGSPAVFSKFNWCLNMNFSNLLIMQVVQSIYTKNLKVSFKHAIHRVFTPDWSQFVQLIQELDAKLLARNTFVVRFLFLKIDKT